MQVNAKSLAIKNSIGKVTSYSLFWVVVFSVVTAIAAQIKIPVYPVPFTLQTMTVVLAGAFLGSRRGAYSQIIYLALGATGLPVFSAGSIGITALFGPTGGYLLAFPIGAFITGLIVERYKNYFTVVTAMFFGEVVINLLGALFLNTFYIHNIFVALKVGAAIFSLWTVIKVFSGASIFFGIRRTKN
jgi:biotin transport system substrate-specific component